jgi:hypothetical protein
MSRLMSRLLMEFVRLRDKEEHQGTITDHESTVTNDGVGFSFTFFFFALIIVKSLSALLS